MSEADADILGALVSVLRADAGVTALAGANVFGSELPQEAAAQMPDGALVVQASGGVSLTAGSDAPLDTQRIDLMAYGKTPRLANDLLRAGTAVLRPVKRLRVGGVLIHWINLAGGFFTARERDGLWPQSFRSFQIFYTL